MVKLIGVVFTCTNFNIFHKSKLALMASFLYYCVEVNILISLILATFLICFLFLHCHYYQKQCLNFEIENEQHKSKHNNKFENDNGKKNIRFLKNSYGIFQPSLFL